MNEFINKMSDNNSKISQQNNKKEIPYTLLAMKNSYRNFIEQMDKSDFKNSPRRYIVELNYAKKAKEIALSYNLNDEAEEMLKKEKNITAKLKDEFGIVIKD